MGAEERDLATFSRVVFNWAAVDHKPRMIVRGDASVLWTNRGAQRLLAECSGIHVVTGQVRLSNAEQDAQFNVLLKASESDLQTLALKFDGEESFCVFRSRWFPEVDGCCIDVRFSSRTYAPILMNLDEVFGLTASESRTAAALYGGQSARELAEDQRISIDTVRSHIRQLYSKIGVSGREQLFRQLDAFRLD